MRQFVLCCCGAVLVGCARPEQRPAQDTTAAATPTPAAAPAGISLADVAGKWATATMTDKGDSTLVKYELVATGDITGWTLNFPKRKPVPVHVTVGGDSVIYDAGPYESVLRKGSRSRPTAWLASRTASWWARPSRDMPPTGPTRCAT